jgi:hypothetical protein
VFLPKNTIFKQNLQLELQVHDRGLLRDVDRHPEANSADLDHRIRTSHPRGEPERGGAQTLPQLNGKHEDIQFPSAGVTGKKDYKYNKKYNNNNKNKSLNVRQSVKTLNQFTKQVLDFKTSFF